MPSNSETYLALNSRVCLKKLEFPSVYKPEADELYEVDALGFEELSRCDGTYEMSSVRMTRDFMEFCFTEGILRRNTLPSKKLIRVGRNEIPSLRYLMVEVTDRCNLSCAHCYVGEGKGKDMDVGMLSALAEEFENMGGLRFILTGGEPLLHPRFGEINQLLMGRDFRSILLTNGTLVDCEIASEIQFDEVQVSIDGMRQGHEIIRGRGTFDQVVKGLEHLREAGVPVSVATMIHRKNLTELKALGSFIRSYGVIGWALDVPCSAGRLEGKEEFIIPEAREAIRYLNLSFGSEQHESTGNYTCGAHLACVKVSGVLTKCGFYDDWNGGNVSEGLREAWRRLPKIVIDELECDCAFLDECRGGCRYRAELHSNSKGPDPLACAKYLGKFD